MLSYFILLLFLNEHSRSAKILYYSRFAGIDINPIVYDDSNYCGNTELWPTSSFSKTDGIWNISDTFVPINWGKWGGWYDCSQGASPLEFNSTFVFKYASQSQNSIFILGYPDNSPYDVFLLKIFANLPKHYQVQIEFILSLRSAIFILNEQGTSEIDFTVYESNFMGYEWRSIYINSTFNHSLDTLRFAIHKNSTNGFFALRDFNVYLITTCDGSCLTCSENSSNCTTCPALSTLRSGKCICKDKFYMETIPYTHCEKCHISCKTCTGAGNSQCSSCYSDFNLSSLNSCVAEPFVYQMSPEFTDYFDLNALASWDSSQSSVSTQCLNKSIVGLLDGEDWMKKTFFIAQPHYKVGVYLDLYAIDNWNGSQFYIEVSSTDITNFYSYRYKNDANLSFLSFCAGCWSDSFQDIYVARNFSESNFTLLLKTDLPIQANATWGFNNFQLTIFQCWPTCQTCSNPTSTDCVTCYNHSTLKIDTNECKCDDGFYMIINSNPCKTTPCSTCAKCEAPCEKCEETPNSCISCIDNYFLFSNSCQNICPNGTYADSFTKKCLPCDDLCLTCNGVGASQCLSCNENYFLYSNTCQNICPNRTYADTFDKKCLACDDNFCLNCNESTSQCLSCIENYFLFSNTCHNICPNGTYADNSTNKCLPCNESCSTCQGMFSNECLTCNSKYFLSSGQCFPCDISCLTCNGVDSTQCLSCIGNYFLFSNTCQNICPNGTYADIFTNKCLSCNESCLTCQGKSSKECLTCYSGNVLSFGECLACDTSCLTCNDVDATHCLTCESSLYLENGACVSNCSSNYYQVDSPKKECSKCPNTCLTCRSGNYSSCMTCAENCFFTLLDKSTKTGSCDHMNCPFNLKKDASEMKCVENCSSFQYYDSFSNECRNCDNSCASCFGPSSSNCFSCQAPYYLADTSCQRSCPPGYFPNNVTKTCDTCTNNCDFCDNPETCISCSFGTYYILETKTCSKTVEIGQFISNNWAIDNCVYGCLICMNSTFCIQCKNQFFLNLQNLCIEEIQIQPILIADNNLQNLYYLTFNDTWPNFFNNLTNNASSYSISIQGINFTNYTINMNYVTINTTIKTWEIIIDFTSDTSSNTILMVIFNPPEEHPYRLTETNVTTNIPPYNRTITYVSPHLSYISNQAFILLNLSFTSNFSDFFRIINSVMSLEIETISNKTYNHTFNKTNLSNSFTIKIQASKSILGNPKLKISFNNPGYIIYHPMQRLSSSNISISLLDHYQLDSLAQSQIEFLQNFSKVVENTLTPLAFIYGILNFGSLSFIGLEAINIIKFLRYIKINYPPNAQNTFNSNFSDVNLFSPFNNNENTGQIPINWNAYGINANFFANGKDQMLKILIALSLGLIFKTLAMFFRKNKGFFGVFIQKLSVVFFLNVFLLFYMSYMMDLCFYSFINIKYKYLDSSIGILSFNASIWFVILTLISVLFISKMVLGINLASFRRKKNKIVPNFNIIPSSQEHSKIDVTQLPSDELTANMNSSRTLTIRSLKLLKHENSNDSIICKINREGCEGERFKKVGKDKELNESLLILFIDYKQGSKTQKFYAALLMLRYLILPMLVVVMYQETYCLIVCYFILNLLFPIYIIFVNPFDGWCLLLHNLIIEAGILVAINGTWRLYIFEINGIHNYDDRIFNGSMIYYGSIITIITQLSLYVSQILIFVIKKIRYFCSSKKNKKKVQFII